MNQEEMTAATDSIGEEALPIDVAGTKPQKPVIQVRKSKKKKRSAGSRREFQVQVIPITKGVNPVGQVIPVKRVTAYCRVSTYEEAQSTSFGIQVKHREQFQKMIEDCKSGKVDMIITKSISCSARNTVDCLSTIRKLKSLKNTVEIYFEKGRLYPLDDKTDMVLSLMASIAQEESRSISVNIR